MHDTSRLERRVTCHLKPHELKPSVINDVIISRLAAACRPALKLELPLEELTYLIKRIAL